jgi:hypothetical protein
VAVRVDGGLLQAFLLVTLLELARFHTKVAPLAQSDDTSLHPMMSRADEARLKERRSARKSCFLLIMLRQSTDDLLVVSHSGCRVAPSSLSINIIPSNSSIHPDLSSSRTEILSIASAPYLLVLLQVLHYFSDFQDACLPQRSP